jgi:hypothetical protein
VIHFASYAAVQTAYMAGEVSGDEIRRSLIQLLIDVTDPIKAHVVNAPKKKKKFWQKGFMKFLFKGKQSTAAPF